MGFDLGDAFAFAVGGPFGWFAKQGVEVVADRANGVVKEAAHDAGKEFGEGVLDGLEVGVKERIGQVLDGARELFRGIFGLGDHAKQGHKLLKAGRE